MFRVWGLVTVLVWGLVATTASPAVADPASPGPVTVVHRPGHGCRAGLVALTFDDGPKVGTTARLVAILRRYDVPATFFEMGNHATAHPALAQLVERSGFTIGNHTWDHPVLTRLSNKKIRKEMGRTAHAFRHIGVRPTPLMRPPYGAVSRRVRLVMRHLGLTPVLWTIDSNDWRGGGSHRIARRVLRALRPHHTNVVLQHDGVTNSPSSVAAVPLIVRAARARGYCFAALDRHGRPTAPVPVAVVSSHRTPFTGSGSGVDVIVRLARPTTRSVSLRLTSQNVTALAWLDYTGFDRTIRFAPGRTEARIHVPVVAGAVPSRFRVRISRPDHLTLTARSLDVGIAGDLALPLFPTLPSSARGTAVQDMVD